MSDTRMKIKEIFHAIFIIPLTAGNAVTVTYDDFRQETRDTDGSLSSTVTIACLTAVSFVILGVYTGKADEQIRAFYILLGLLISLTLLGLLALALISLTAYKHRSLWFTRPHTRHRDFNLKGKFLWLFGLAVILDTSLNMAANFRRSISDSASFLHQVTLCISYSSVSN